MDYIRKGKWDIMGVELINWLEQERKKIEAAAEAKIAAAEARIDEANARIAAAEARAYERFAKAMLEDGMSVSQVAKLYGLDPTVVKQWEDSLTA